MGRKRKITSFSVAPGTPDRLKRLAEDASRTLCINIYPGDVVDVLAEAATAEQVVALVRVQMAGGSAQPAASNG